MRDAGVDTVVLEVSSHSLAMQRVHTLRFEVAVFTNLTQDHLDFHADMDAYAEVKARLFSSDHLAGTAVVHAADPRAGQMSGVARAAGNRVVTFGRGAEAGADVFSSAEQITLEGSTFTLHCAGERRPVSLPLPGDFQLENALAAAAAAHALGADLDSIQRGLAGCEPVPGRLERVSPTLPTVFVDYAHTPDAIDAVLARVRPLVAGRLICVFGCGGDRDRGKRPLMAQAACRRADRVIATTDNPRSESPGDILRDVAEGLSGDFAVIEDRRSAIRAAVTEAARDDVIVIAGKGHEDYQLVAGERLAFDDREEARAALEAAQ
jgi:UDP-N-acetylmuramoyl-L-alanyl-D-glutamate--2,6-diaminopimelate ligase